MRRPSNTSRSMAIRCQCDGTGRLRNSSPETATGCPPRAAHRTPNLSSIQVAVQERLTCRHIINVLFEKQFVSHIPTLALSLADCARGRIMPVHQHAAPRQSSSERIDLIAEHWLSALVALLEHGVLIGAALFAAAFSRSTCSFAASPLACKLTSSCFCSTACGDFPRCFFAK